MSHHVGIHAVEAATDWTNSNRVELSLPITGTVPTHGGSANKQPWHLSTVSRLQDLTKMAEGERFELSEGFPSAVFKTAAINQLDQPSKISVTLIFSDQALI